MPARLNIWLMLLSLGLSTAMGCGGPAGPPPTATASGTVTLGGQPVTSGQIYFVANDKGYSANTALDGEGKYKITSSLPPGSYKVFFTRPRITTPPMIGGPAPERDNTFRIPDKYQSEQLSGLSADVKAGENTLNFDLK